ncbi:acyl-CoA synthetase FdrA [Carnobacteriaceae bacterium zg-C25]|nr:acyl-CoA synthetase FdrA [Carnobacteriaceae bacterium zg-C25]
MLVTEIIKNNYQDSINLMLLTQQVNTMDGVIKSQIMMGSDANKDILESGGLLSDEAKTATPNDLVIVIDTDNPEIKSAVLEVVDEFLSDLSVKENDSTSSKEVTSLQEALEQMPDANLALFSIPGEYGASEMEKALNKGLNVFSFTDNVPIEDEVRLKKLAHEKGLLMMGPDCGTGVISSVPLAFTNVITPGNIGIVGASGTGIQEVATIIDRLGCGVVHAIGTGGRDLSDKVGAITVKDAIVALEYHDETDVICVISKPAAKEVRDEVVALLQSVSKPVVAIFLGEKPEHHEGKVYLAHTLEETARIAVDLAKGVAVNSRYQQPLENTVNETLADDKVVIGLYSGGTLASEAGMLISEALDLGKLVKSEGYILRHNGYDVMDLGDDIYTQGRPHPMIDPEVRINKFKEYAAKANTGVILFDVVLGYGAHDDMAGALLPSIKDIIAQNPNVHFIATVVGTKHDPQNYETTIQRLKEAGVLVESSNEKAVRLALKFKGVDYEADAKSVVSYSGKQVTLTPPSQAVKALLHQKPKVINIGLKSFNEPIIKYEGESVQYNWRPIAGGNKKMISILNYLEQFSEEIDAENATVVQRMKEVQPFLVDVVKAKTVIPELNDPQQKTLLHAGPPITWETMTGPMQGSCLGAALFEKWAETEEEARELFESGAVRFIPCHHVNAVGPMGGITSGDMAVLVVENKADKTRAYCTMNEGIGKVLRFGAYSPEVVTRLEWMRDILGPTIASALKVYGEGINLNVLIAKAITMGDEFHQRNIAASLNFVKEIVPAITQLDIDSKVKYDVIKFLSDTDQFFLNIMMATGKVIVDVARKDAKGTVVTTMTRNGVDFGVRIAETNDAWYTAPVNTPRGLYFTGFSEEDGNPDIGDSAITETVGVGAMAMIAAPGVTRFVGAGGFQEAIATSQEMARICVTRNSNWSIPNWNFEGSVLGIDIRKVVETGITPIINTGIAHKQPGLGQVGAGTVLAPLGCFEKALEAYAISKGYPGE